MFFFIDWKLPPPACPGTTGIHSINLGGQPPQEQSPGFNHTSLQGGPLPVLNVVITRINGLTKWLCLGLFHPTYRDPI